MEFMRAVARQLPLGMKLVVCPPVQAAGWG